jgi:Tfp pilus assembly protein PilF
LKVAIKDNLLKMLSKGRDDAMLRFGIGSALFTENEFAQAVEHLEACLAHDETYTAAYKLLGKSYFKLGQQEDAKRTFDRGLPIAQAQGDKQTVKEITVFLKKINKEAP